MNNKKVIAIIPARGGSKRLPEKNILPLKGKPLIEYSIEFAKNNLDVIDEIVVTTDDKAIKEIALKHNVKVIDRPENLADDTATTVSALKHVLQNVVENFDYVVLLQPTNPFRERNLLKNSFELVAKTKADSLMTVSQNDKKLGKIVNNKFEPYTYKMGQRSQDLEPLYFENGLLYISKATLILNAKILAENNVAYITNHPFSKVDIDTREDFKYAEFILSNYPNE